MNKVQLTLITLSVLLFTSISANLLLYRGLKSTFINLYQISLNPLGIGKYSNQQDVALEKVPRVVFFGDSRAYAWKAPENNNFQFINRGISGQTSAQTLWRFEHHVATLKPQVIVIQLGINDLRMLPNDSQTRLDLVKNCQQNITQIIERARRINATVILTTIFPLGAGNVSLQYRPFWASLEDMAQSINEVNHYLKSLQNEVIIIDAHTLLEDKDSNKIKYYKDLLHLNHRGYQLLNQELEKTLMALPLKSTEG